MNPGAAEEAGKVAQSLIGALKDSPALLMVVLLNLVFLVFMYITLNRTYDRTTKQLERGDELLAKALEKCGSK